MKGTDNRHTVTARDGSFDSGAVFTQDGATFERRFDESGKTFEYACKVHKDCCMMSGSVRVGRDAPEPLPGY
jgi:plastocyanin